MPAVRGQPEESLIHRDHDYQNITGRKLEISDSERVGSPGPGLTRTRQNY